MGQCKLPFPPCTVVCPSQRHHPSVLAHQLEGFSTFQPIALILQSLKPFHLVHL